jgi:carboxylesterase type B
MNTVIANPVVRTHAGVVRGYIADGVTSGDPGWPRYDLSRRTTVRFDMTSQPLNDPLASERALWAGLR